MAKTTKKNAAEEVDIFAISETKTTSTKKAEKPKVQVPKEADTLISDFLKLTEEIDSKQSKLETIKGKLKAVGVDKYLERYVQDGKNGGSFLMENSKGEIVLFTPKDQYLKLEKEDHEYLNNKYEGQISEQSETVAFDKKMFEKHRKAISTALMACKEIPDADKPKLFVKTIGYNIKKGTIEKIVELRTWLTTKLKREVTINEVYDDVRVISAMSGREE